MENSEIIFTLPKDGYATSEKILENIPTDEIIKINNHGFFYKGEQVDDVHNVYERFNEWLTIARKLNNLE